jgi:hypothetical protein
MQLVAVEPGGDLLFDGAVEDGVFQRSSVISGLSLKSISLSGRAASAFNSSNRASVIGGSVSSV